VEIAFDETEVGSSILAEIGDRCKDPGAGRALFHDIIFVALVAPAARKMATANGHFHSFFMKASLALPLLLLIQNV